MEGESHEYYTTFKIYSPKTINITQLLKHCQSIRTPLAHLGSSGPGTPSLGSLGAGREEGLHEVVHSRAEPTTEVHMLEDFHACSGDRRQSPHWGRALNWEMQKRNQTWGD